MQWTSTKLGAHRVDRVHTIGAMNWLAHSFLSEPDSEFRLGNLLADLVKRTERPELPSSFLRGMHQHKVIDAFTDSHPIVHRSRARIRGNYRHTRGILIDVFYDHFLSLAWDGYCPEPLDAFAAGVYADIRSRPAPLPGEARLAADWMIHDDRLASYRTIAGIESALYRVSQRLSTRLGRPFALQESVGELRDHFEPLRLDFAEFFPLLRAHVEQTAL